jgi:acyl transferase domain-containing protein/acyl carrier protein
VKEDKETHGIAVVGMAGRFPGAPSVEDLWQNLVNGVESVSELDPLKWAETAGVHPALLDRPDLVKMKPTLADEFLFDAGFFGYTPREAQVLDPQQRIFLECAWEALESAGYDSERFEGAIAVAAGVSQSSYLMNYLQWDQRLVDAVGGFNIGLANMNDSLATRVAYKLNLRGPAYAVQSFCSTSLVAVHLGCQSLLGRESDMVLAGGATLYLPHEVGYQYQEGGILSPDGHTRTFDARARGMVFGSGVAVVVLKRLADARRDGDTVHAVILGSAINNDGSLKVGFTAPSVTGQAEVITEALTAAGVNPETIGYVEAHGTGTGLGDPAEIAGLTKAWRRWTDRKDYCAIGSVKTNIGHLDAAAGVTGLIKAALTLRHRVIPPSLHFESPNPAIDFASSPFHVNARLTEWNGEGPHRAAVSSFGIGGTNAHAILEEEPAGAPSAPARDGQLLILSARTPTALDRASGRLRAHLEAHPGANLADVAFTLQVGRRVFGHRRAVVARDLSDAVAALADPTRAESAQQDRRDAPVAFLFTGQGSQYVNMGRGLYETERRFREVVDAAAETLARPLGLDLRRVLYPEPGGEDGAGETLQETFLTQPALFVIECALARLWMSWGVQPAAMIGHSVGEYVAAHLAGVFTLEEALALVAERGRLMQSLPRGSMLAVPLSEEALLPFLVADVSLASVNAPGACVLSGPAEAIDAMESVLTARGVMSRRLRTSHAFHSSMMDPVLEPFRARVEATERRTPQVPFVSNVTGEWTTAEEATAASYWSRHLRGCVRFADGLRRLQADRPGAVLLEVGPGSTLASLARQQLTAGSGSAVATSLRHPRETVDDRSFLLKAVGRLWLSGARVDWSGMSEGERRRRVPLPTYPFERKEYKVSKVEKAREAFSIVRGYSLRKQEVDDWFYQPSWRRVALPAGGRSTPARWLVFADDHGLGDAVAAELRAGGHGVVTVRPGDSFAGDPDRGFTIRPRVRADYASLLQAVAAAGGPATRLMHLWGVTGREGAAEARDRLADAQARGFWSILHLAQALAVTKDAVRLAVVTDGMQEVVGEDLTRPEKATVLGPCRVASQELKNVSSLSVDVVLPGDPRDGTALARHLLNELLGEPRERMVAYRGRHRWVQWLEPLPLGPATGEAVLRDGGVYLITGGLGGIGLVLAEHLARTRRARLVLTARSPLPSREAWNSGLADATASEAVRQRIRQVLALEELGAEVLVAAADVASLPDMEAAVARGVERFGAIHGVVHAAGVAGGGVIELKDEETAARVLAPKVEGTLVLEQALRGQRLDFLVLCSSTAAWVGGVGQVDYCGANAFLDAYAQAAPRTTRTIAIDWDAWREVGMAVNTAVSGALRAARETSLKVGIGSAEGVEAFQRILESGLSQVAVFTMDLMPRLLNRFVTRADEEAVAAEGAEEATAAATAARGAGGPLAGAGGGGGGPAPPPPPPPARGAGGPLAGGGLERAIAESWRKVLGRERIEAADNFFELGGDSLTALQAMSHLKAALGREIPIVTLYESPTVAGLARALSAERKADEAPPDLGDAGQRAGTRLEMMQRRRRARASHTLGDQEPA